jgi:hypothetical protein
MFGPNRREVTKPRGKYIMRTFLTSTVYQILIVKPRRMKWSVPITQMGDDKFIKLLMEKPE